MDEILYEIYTRCFERYPIASDTFYELLRPELGHLIYAEQDDQIVGYSLIHGHSISLMCVCPEFQNKGYGSILLRKSEDYIKEKATESIVLGCGDYYIFQGVPEDHHKAIEFFKKHGYKADYSSVNMELQLDLFSINNLNIPACSDDVEFRFYDGANQKELMEAVIDADESWKDIFSDCSDPIMLAISKNKILGFQILSPEGGRFKVGNEKIGSIGCVGVIHSARQSGIGRRLVLSGIQWLKSQGCNRIELLYVELIEWYKKLGFYVTHRQWMGEKKL